MAELILVLDRKSIDGLVAEVGARISEDYSNSSLVLVGVLKGAFIFLADLVRSISIPVEIDFIQAASYGAGTTSSGNIQIKKDIDVNVRDKHVLLVEDIVDTGMTLHCLESHLLSLGAASVRACAMIDKVERRKAPVDVAYACHTVREGFLVGYGLDYDQKYRELPEIYHLKF